MEKKLDQLEEMMKTVYKELCEQYSAVVKYENYIKKIHETRQRKSERIVLNVGGTTFETERSVLTTPKAEDSMLFAIGAGWFDNTDTEEGTFIDRDGTLFGVILAWLRDTDSDRDEAPDLEPGKSAPLDGGSILLSRTILHGTNHHASLQRASADYGSSFSSSSVVRTLSDENHYSGLLETGITKTSALDELTCLEVEARYYGLDKLVAEIEQIVTRRRRACPGWLENWHNKGYQRIGDSHLKVLPSGSIKHAAAISYTIHPGMKVRVEMHFVDSDEFTINLYDAMNTSCVSWESKADHKQIGVLSPTGIHVVVLVVDWTDWNAAAAEFRNPAIDVTLDNMKWVGLLHTNIRGFVVPRFATLRPGSEMLLHRIDLLP